MGALATRAPMIPIMLPSAFRAYKVRLMTRRPTFAKRTSFADAHGLRSLDGGAGSLAGARDICTRKGGTYFAYPVSATTVNWRVR